MEVFPKYDPSHNYCGPEGWKVGFPNEFYGVNINYACYKHDEDYWRGGTPRMVHAQFAWTAAARKSADQAFLLRMRCSLKDTHKWWNPKYFLAWRRIRKYYFFVRNFGKACFVKKGES